MNKFISVYQQLVKVAQTFFSKFNSIVPHRFMLNADKNNKNPTSPLPHLPRTPTHPRPSMPSKFIQDISSLYNILQTVGSPIDKMNYIQ